MYKQYIKASYHVQMALDEINVAGEKIVSVISLTTDRVLIITEQATKPTARPTPPRTEKS